MSNKGMNFSQTVGVAVTKSTKQFVNPDAKLDVAIVCERCNKERWHKDRCEHCGSGGSLRKGEF